MSQSVLDKWGAMRAELDRRAAEIERLTAELERIGAEQCAACRAKDDFGIRRALEGK